MDNNYLENIMQNDFVNKRSSDIVGKTSDFVTTEPDSSIKSSDSGKFSKSIESSQSGGDTSTLETLIGKPTGGFPPIFKCTRIEVQTKDETKDRGYATKSTAVSIKEIMQQRRDETPFSL
jgi:hypothetical protein